MNGDRIDLSSQVALVTGGGRGIGRAVAGSLAQAGAMVAVLARSPEQVAETVEGITAAGGRALACPADVTDRAAVEAAVAEVERRLGPVDLLVNNAGVGGPVGPLAEADPDEWWRCVEVNLRGPLLCGRAVLPGMRARRGGRIVNVASGAGTRALPYLSAYVTAKAALIRLTETLAADSRSEAEGPPVAGPSLVTCRYPAPAEPGSAGPGEPTESAGIAAALGVPPAGSGGGLRGPPPAAGRPVGAEQGPPGPAGPATGSPAGCHSCQLSRLFASSGARLRSPFPWLAPSGGGSPAAPR